MKVALQCQSFLTSIVKPNLRLKQSLELNTSVNILKEELNNSKKKKQAMSFDQVKGFFLIKIKKIKVP